MINYIFSLLFIFSNSVDAPSAQQLCLEDCNKLNQLLTANPCVWKTQQEGQQWPYDCKAILECTVQDSMNPQYRVCPGEVAGLSEVKWSADSAKVLFETDTLNCKSRETHLKSCHYSPEKVDGTPIGDNPNMSDDYCRIRLKQPSQAPSR